MQQRSICSSSKLSAVEELVAGQEPTPITGHALLREGAVSILALSKRGLFAAGKVIVVYNSQLLTTSVYFDLEWIDSMF